MSKAVFIHTNIAFFFSEPVPRPDLILPEFNKKFPGIFDQSPLVVPIPDRPELAHTPVVQLTSSNGLYSAKFAHKRAEFFHFSSDRKNQYDFAEIQNDFLSYSGKLFEVCRAQNITLERIGFVSRFLLGISSPQTAIAKLLNNKLLNIHKGKVRRASVHYSSEIPISGFTANNYTVLEKAETILYISGKSQNKEGILITRDFNSVPEKVGEYKGKFTLENIQQFIQDSINLFVLDEIAELLL